MILKSDVEKFLSDYEQFVKARGDFKGMDIVEYLQATLMQVDELKDKIEWYENNY
jgi:hypothetical protein